MPTTVDISGLLRRLSDASEQGTRMAKAIVQSTADQIVADAKRNAPADLGKLRQNIGKESLNGGFQGRVFAATSYAPYVEFGTGALVDVPPELADIASQFKGRGMGSFEDFKAAIKGWMQRHGIEEKYAYVIMVSIIRKGLKPRPFLYPAFVRGRATLQPKLETAIRNHLRSA